MHEEPSKNVTPDSAAVDQVWVLEIGTWDSRAMRVKFYNEDTAHQHAVAFLTLQEQTITTLDGIKRAGFDFEVIEG